MKLYVGNLSYRASEADLEGWFSEAGFAVDGVTLIRDRFSGESRGFGFVEINNEEDAARAVQSCNGRDFMGRAVVVNEARPQAERKPGGPGRGGRGPGGKGGGRRQPRW